MNSRTVRKQRRIRANTERDGKNLNSIQSKPHTSAIVTHFSQVERWRFRPKLTWKGRKWAEERYGLPAVPSGGIRSKRSKQNRKRS